MNPRIRFPFAFVAPPIFSLVSLLATASASAQPNETRPGSDFREGRSDTTRPSGETKPTSPTGQKRRGSLDEDELLAELPDDLDADDLSLLRPRLGARRWAEIPRSYPVGLSVVGWSSNRVLDKRELGAGITLSIPLEVTAGRARPATLERPALQTMNALTREPAKAISIDPAQEVKPTEVRELVKCAWREAGLDQDARLGDLAHRARWSATLPELRMKVTRTTGQTLRLDPTIEDPTRIQASGQATMLYEARATWRLDRLVFADDEVTLERIRVDRDDQRMKLSLKVIELVTTWRKALARQQDPTMTSTDKLEAEATIASSGAALDALTDGVWSRQRGSRDSRDANATE